MGCGGRTPFSLRADGKTGDFRAEKEARHVFLKLFSCKLPEFALTLFIVELKTRNTMGKNRKKVTHTQREEQQGRKVMMTIGIVAVALVVLMFVVYSYWG